MQDPISVEPAVRQAPDPPVGGRAAHGQLWDALARLWRQLGPPLRPADEDVRFYQQAVDRWARDHGPPRALILGVTPELWRLDWPAGSDVLAVDQCQPMIENVWPGPRQAVLNANWASVPLTDGSRDLVLCDGGLLQIPYPQDQQSLVRTLARIIAPGGVCVIRFFVPARPAESADRVLQDLVDGDVANVNLLKLRLGMAMQASGPEGIELDCIWRRLHSAVPDLAGVAERVGWTAEHVAAIDAYRGRLNRYHFLDVDEINDLFCGEAGTFELLRTDWPGYELGERCPTISFGRVTP